jgi:hypothetical protein
MEHWIAQYGPKEFSEGFYWRRGNRIYIYSKSGRFVVPPGFEANLFGGFTVQRFKDGSITFDMRVDEWSEFVIVKGEHDDGTREEETKTDKAA